MGTWHPDQDWKQYEADFRANNIQVGVARKGEEPPDAVVVTFRFEMDGTQRTVTALLVPDEASAFLDAFSLMLHETELS